MGFGLEAGRQEVSEIATIVAVDGGLEEAKGGKRLNEWDVSTSSSATTKNCIGSHRQVFVLSVLVHTKSW